MRTRLAKFLKHERESIQSLIDEADKLTTPQVIVEFGQFFDANLDLFWRTYGQSYVWNPTEQRYIVSAAGGYDTMQDIWPSAPHWGILHTHPNSPGMDRLSDVDGGILDRSDVRMMLVATRSGGRYQVIARWDSEERQEEERFDLYPSASTIARFLAWVLHLEPWQLILADTNGDGKVSIIDAMLAARKAHA